MNGPGILFFFLLTAGLALVQGQEKAPPAESAPPAQTEMMKWIATTDAPWQALFKREVGDVHDLEVGKLKQQYQAAIDAALAKASNAGDLKGALALRDEQKRFRETQMVPSQDDAAEGTALKQPRTTFLGQLARVEKENAVRAKALCAKYDQVLAQAQAQLTQHQRLDDAVLVQTKRDEVAAAWLPSEFAQPAYPAVTARSNAKPVSTPPATTPKPGPGASSDLLGAGGLEAQMAKLTRTAWLWETVMGKSTIKFEKDGTCVHTHFTGTFEFQKDDTVLVKWKVKQQLLVFDFGKGTFTGYDPVLKQAISGRRTYQK